MNNNRFSPDSPASTKPLYNIGIVSRMTGIPVATLRVWERRYGFPNSTRTPGGHRLCSEHEVIRLRWVKARVDEGMQTGQAIRALQHLEREGRFNEAALVAAAMPIVGDPTLATFRKQLTRLLLEHNLVQADQLLGQVIALYPLEDLILDVIAPTLNDIGEAWTDGRISIASEHLATYFLRQHLLMWMSAGPAPYSGVPPTVLVCAPDEWHDGSLMILGVMLRRLRWPIAYLGQSVPLADVSQLVRQVRAPAVVFVAMTERPARALADWPQHFAEAAQTGKPAICYGGRAFVQQPELRERVPGLFLGNSLREGAQKLDQMLRTALHPMG